MMNSSAISIHLRLFLLTIVCLLFLSILPAIESKSKRTKTETQWKNKRRDCERFAPPEGCLTPQTTNEERQNCINKCADEYCFNDVYGPTTSNGELEDGEIDLDRGRLFTACVRRRQREGKKNREKERREQRVVKKEEEEDQDERNDDGDNKNEEDKE